MKEKLELQVIKSFARRKSQEFEIREEDISIRVFDNEIVLSDCSWGIGEDVEHLETIKLVNKYEKIKK